VSAFSFESSEREKRRGEQRRGRNRTRADLNGILSFPFFRSEERCSSMVLRDWIGCWC